jgi:hypothetical protein
MAGYFSNTEYHQEQRMNIASGLGSEYTLGKRSALAVAVEYNLNYVMADGFKRTDFTVSDWERALHVTNDVASGGIFDYTTNADGVKVRSAYENALSRGVADVVTGTVFSEFDNNISYQLKDSRNALKSIIGDAYRIDPSTSKAYASQVVFENIFGSVLSKDSNYLPANPDNYYSSQAYNYMSAFAEFDYSKPKQGANANESMRSRGQETLDRLVYADLFGEGIVPISKNKGLSTAQLNARFNNVNSSAGSTISDLDFIRLRSMTNELTNGGVSRTKRLTSRIDSSIDNSYTQHASKIIDNVMYQTRPGILPFVAMFEGAKDFITIDTFQFQNKSISDVVASKVFREVLYGRGGKPNLDFRLKFIVGSPIPGEDATGSSIFGPNIIEVAKLQLLKETIKKELSKIDGMPKGNALTEAVDKIFEVKLAGPAHHRKVYITDQAAVLGSINLTSPVGDSVFKAGSNFETFVMFHRNEDVIRTKRQRDRIVNEVGVDNEIQRRIEDARKQQYRDVLFFAGRGELEEVNASIKRLKDREKNIPIGITALANSFNPDDLAADGKNAYKKYVSAIMYNQVLAAQKDQERTRSRQNNVKYATDIMYTLKATIDYMYGTAELNSDNSLELLKSKYVGDLSMRVVLDQAYLLHVNHLDVNGRTNRSFDSEQNQEVGEMGKFARSVFSMGSFKDRQDIRYDMYRAMQKKNFALIAMGITKVAVDSKNLTGQIIEPTWNYISNKLGSTFATEYGSSIGTFVNAVTRDADTLEGKVRSIKAKLGNVSDLSAYQMLAIASGNIVGASVPRQHTKAFAAYRGQEQISSYLGSANMGMYNLGVGTSPGYLGINGNDPFVTDEMGVVFINRAVFEQAAVSTKFDSDFRDNVNALAVVNNAVDLSLDSTEEMYMLRENNRAVVMDYDQLTQGNRIDNNLLPSIEGLPYWARQRNTSDLLKLESSLKEMAKGLGDAITIQRKYDRFGAPLALDVSINIGNITGQNISTSRLTYTLGMLQGTANQPGAVYFQKEGKLVYNSNFTNASNSNMTWKYGAAGSLASGSSVEMTSIDNTTSMLATMITEMAYRQAIGNPAERLMHTDDVGKRSLMYDFAISVLDGTRDKVANIQRAKRGKGGYQDAASLGDYIYKKRLHKKLAGALESRFTSGGVSYLDNVRGLAGVDVNNHESRRILQAHIQDIRNAKSGEDIAVSLGSLGSLIGTRGFEDLSLDVIRINSSFNQDKLLSAQMRQLATSMFDPWLGAHQVNSYGSAVPANKLPNYGVNAGDTAALNMIGYAEQHSSQNGLLDVVNYARTFARDIGVYSAFGVDELGQERFYVGGVAEGVSTQSKEDYQLELFGIRNKFATDRSRLAVLEATGIGILVDKTRLISSGFISDSDANKVLEKLGIKENEQGIVFNLDPNKPAQINQRIKNAMGSRLLYEINAEVADILMLGKDSQKYNEGTGSSIVLLKQDTGVNKPAALEGLLKRRREVYRRSIELLKSKLGNDREKTDYLDNYLNDEELRIGLIYETDVRGALHKDAYDYVVERRRELLDTFKDVNLDSEDMFIINNMFRMKMVNYSFTPNTTGSVVGGLRTKPQFLLMQLNGAYSDHFYLNPVFRTQYYGNAGSVTTTGIKASMLDARTFVGEITLDGTKLANDGLIVNEGDMFLYDSRVNKVVQVRADGKESTTYVGGTGSSDYLIGQIENFSLHGKPVASVKQRSTSNRPGEDSVQYVLTAKRIESGSGVTNEIRYEIHTINMLAPGSGRRHEGSAFGGLFKGVGAVLSQEQFNTVFTSFRAAVGSKSINSINLLDVDVKDIYGLVNPNNIKSGFYIGHGSALMTYKIEGTNNSLALEIIKRNTNQKVLAAALISMFGTDVIDNNRDAVRAYKMGAMRGEYGEYLKLLELQKSLSGKGMQDFERNTSNYVDVKSNPNLFGSIPQFIVNNEAFKIEIIKAVKGETSRLGYLLEGYIEEVTQKSGGYILNSTDFYTRGVTAIVTALDLFNQLKDQTGHMTMVHDWLLTYRKENGLLGTNDPLLAVAAALGGSSDAFKYNVKEADGGYSEEEKMRLANLLGIYLQQNFAVAISLNVLPSASKDPLGKNLRAKTELQHLLVPLYAQTKQFKQGKGSSLSYVLGTIFAAQDNNLISLSMVDNNEYLQSIKAVDALDRGIVSGFFGKNFIGTYYNPNENTAELITRYRKIYSTGIRKDFAIDQVDTYLSEGTLTLAEAALADKTNAATNAANKGGNLLPTTYVKKLGNIARNIIIELKDSSLEYNLEQSKGMGTDITLPKLDMLKKTGNRSISLILPEIVGNQSVNQMTGDINTVFSNTQSRYLFLPGAELLSHVGSSFGDFVSDIVGRSMNMYSYFTPGTAENDLLIKLSKARRMQGGSKHTTFNINLSKEETIMLGKLYSLGDELLQAIVEASSDTLMQKAVAGHGTEFAGFVSTPVPNMSIASNQMISPEYVNERFGEIKGISKLRKEWLSVTNAAYLNFVKFGDDMGTGGMLDKYKNDTRVKNFVHTMNIVVDVQRQMLIRGLSTAASLELQGHMNALSNVHEVITKINKGETLSKQQYEAFRAEMNSVQKSVDKIVSNLDSTQAYDKAYATSYVLANYQFAQMKMDAARDPRNKSKLGHINDWLMTRGYSDAVYFGSRHEVRDFIHRSSEKHDYSFGLDLINLYSKELEGAARGKQTIYTQPAQRIKELVDESIDIGGVSGGRRFTLEYVNNKIFVLQTFIDKFAATNSNEESYVQQRHLAKVNRKSVDNVLSGFNEIKKSVQEFNSSDKEEARRFYKHALLEIGYIHNTLNELDLMQNQSWRSAPFGSTEPHLGTLMAIRGANEFNKMMDALTTDKNIVRYDAERSKSLSVFSGLSFLTSNLGDFDGDNYITLMHKVTEKVQDIESLEVSLLSIKKQIRDKSKNVLPAAQARDYTALGNYYNQVESLEEKIQHKETQIALAHEQLNSLHADLNSTDTKGKMAKDIAAYMGIDHRFFVGDDTGFRGNKGTLDVSSMAVMLEQGRGLYGGLQGVSSEVNVRVDNLLRAGLLNSSSGNIDQAHIDQLLNSLDSRDSLNKITMGLANAQNSITPEDQNAYDSLKNSLQETIRLTWHEMQKKGSANVDHGGAHTAEEFYMNLVSKVHAVSKADGALNKIMGAGIGIGMADTTYDVLTKTLGKAGSDVLGKTYNTLLGTFIADSPIVSLHHILEGDKDRIAAKLNEKLGDDAGTKYISVLQASYDKAQDLQGWNKAVQQMLRDSIKLKGDSKSVMGRLQEIAQEYTAADEEKRKTLIDEMASKIGPGAGMQGLIHLNQMIQHASKGQSAYDYGTAQDYNFFGRSSQNAQDKVLDFMQHQSESSLIKYKVSNELRSITTMFNFEKSFGAIEVDGKGTIKIDNKISTNKALEFTLGEGLEGFLGASDKKVKHQMKLLAEASYLDGKQASARVNSLYDEVARIKGEGLNEDTKRTKIIEAFNTFSGDVVGAENGYYSDMLYAHAGIQMNDKNREQLNKSRNSEGLSAASLLVLSHHYAIGQTLGLMGDYGEGLDRFVHLNKAAQTVQRGISKRFYETGTNLLGSDLFNAAYRLSAQGKLGTRGANVMTKLYKAVNDPNLSNAKAMGQMLNNFSSGSEDSRQLAENYEHLLQVELEDQIVIDEGRTVTRKQTVGEKINRESEKTAQGFKLMAISEVATAMAHSGDISMNNYRSIRAKIKSGAGLDDREIDNLSKELMSGPTLRADVDYFKPAESRGGAYAEEHTAVKARSTDVAANVLGPAMLSILGGLIYGSSRDQAGMDVQGIIGGTISLMGFNMPHATKTSRMAGTIFRANAYKNPDEDWATNMARAAATETSLLTVGSLVTPRLTQFVSNNIVAPLTKSNVPIVESSVSAVIGSFVGAIAMNLLDRGIQNSVGLLKTTFNGGDNSLVAGIQSMQAQLFELSNLRADAEDSPLTADSLIDIPDKLSLDPLIKGVWASDTEVEMLMSMTSEQLNASNETYLTGGEYGYV